MSIDVPTPSLGPGWDPQRPAQRVYISGYTYKLATGSIARPPLIDTVKLVANWIGPAARVAKNIFYALFASDVDTTNAAFLKAVANQVMTSWAGSATMANIANTWALQSVTAHDNGMGSGTTATSDHALIPGTASGDPVPPQSAVVFSWQIAAAYRGGKPRWYIPGLAANNLSPAGSSQFSSALATILETAAANFMSSFNSATIMSFVPLLGTISYSTGHTPRPTPIFRNFTGVRVHERLDSQRRRSGRESSFGSVP